MAQKNGPFPVLPGNEQDLTKFDNQSIQSGSVHSIQSHSFYLFVFSDVTI